MMDSFRRLLALTLLPLSGCSAGDGEQCVHRLRQWPLNDPRPSIAGFSHYSIEVTSTGAVTWEGGSTTPQEIPEFLKISETMTPSPFIVLDTDATSDCRVLEQVRQHLDRSSLCRQGFCAERRTWQERLGG